MCAEQHWGVGVGATEMFPGAGESAGRQELLLGFVCWNLHYFHSSRVLSLFPDILSPEWGERISLGTGGTLGGKWGRSK